MAGTVLAVAVLVMQRVNVVMAPAMRVKTVKAAL